MSAIQLQVTIPSLRVGVGPFAFDLVQHLLGASISDLLGPLMTGPMTQRRGEGGTLVDVYRLALPQGEGVGLPLGEMGEVVLFNLCFARHKFNYAEAVPMHSASSVAGTCERSSPNPTPHNQLVFADATPE